MKRFSIYYVEDKEKMEATSFDIFIHGPELWRLQKTIAKDGDKIETPSIDFTKEEFKKYMPFLYGKAITQLSELEKDEVNLDNKRDHLYEDYCDFQANPTPGNARKLLIQMGMWQILNDHRD